ncbi:MAG: TonB-dependent receptor [Gemmatimonadaceae bacterium]|nr:TonB-dependent receptor [Gemmatimonadaceae bacterium]
MLIVSTSVSRYFVPTMLVAMVPVSSLSAQSDSTRADSTRRPPAALTTVRVTAQRRDEAAQRVGIAVTPLTATQLAERGVQGPFDLQRVTPGLEVEPAFGSGQPQYRLRGLGFSDYATNNSSTVGVYADDAALPFPVQTQGLLFDLDRVEVLRGPQGTLYGRNSTGGAINFVSRRPTAAHHRGVQADIGTFGAVNAEGFVSGKLASRLLGRLSAATQQGGAWQHDRVNDRSLGARDHSAVRGQLDWRPHDRLSVLFIGNAFRDHSDGQGLALFAPLATRGGEGPTIPADGDRRATGWGLRPAFARLIGVDSTQGPGRRNTGTSGSIQLRHVGQRMLFTSITSYARLDRHEIGDWDASASAESDEAFRTRIGVASQEFRLTSTTGGAFEWQGGVYAAHERLDDRFYSDFTNVPGLAAPALTQYGQRADAAAVFAQAGYAFTPEWRVVGGLRLEYESRKLEGLTTGFIDPVVVFVPPTDGAFTTRLPSGKLALEYRPTATALTYLSFDRGIKSGGFTAYNTTNPAQLANFAPEIVNAVELGAKVDVGTRMRVNAALYHYDYRDQQVLSTVYDQVSRGPIGRIANAPRSRIHGAEVEWLWQITPQLDVQQYWAVRAGRYQEFTTVDAQASIAAGREVTRDFAGTWLNIPRHSLGGAATYAFNAARLSWRAQASYSYRDQQEASRLIFSPEYDVAPYALVNGSITAQRAGSPWSVQLFGRNLADRRYELTRNFFINARVTAIGQPATAGIRVRYER